MSTQKQTSREDAERFITEYYKSGLTCREFCGSHKINTGTFRWWLKRHRESNEVPRTPFLKIKATNNTTSQKSPESEFIIDFPTGARLRWRGTEIPQQLSTLLGQLHTGSLR